MPCLKAEKRNLAQPQITKYDVILKLGTTAWNDLFTTTALYLLLSVLQESD
jgi:hypothetical protein